MGFCCFFFTVPGTNHGDFEEKKRKDGESTYLIPVKVPAPVSLICLWRAEINSQAESPSKTRGNLETLTLQAFV